MANSKKGLSFGSFLAIMIALSLLAVGVAVLVGQGIVSDIAIQFKVQNAKNVAITQLDKNLEAAPKLVAAYKDMGPDKELLANALPTNADYPGLLVALDAMAIDSGIKLKNYSSSFSVEDAISVADYPSVQSAGTTISADCSYDALSKFVKNIESSARPIRIVSMQISGSGSSLSTQMELVTYFQDKAKIPYKTEAVK